MKYINYQVFGYRGFLSLLVLFSFGIGQAFSQIVKIELDGYNNCSGQIQVDIKIKSSDFSTTDFSIGSSSIFLNFDPQIVSYNSYTPVEFDADVSTQAAGANWLPHRYDVDATCGLFDLTLQKEEGGVNNYDLNKSTYITIGTVYFDFVFTDTDPMISINQLFTMFNSADQNDGTAMRDIENYPKLLQYSCNNCVSPTITSINETPSTCIEENGAISFTFPNDPTRTFIEFSIDGGLTYPFNINDNVGTYNIIDLASGTYDLWVRWGNNNCPLDLPDATIITTGGPTASVSATNSCGAQNDGVVTFTFPNTPGRTGIEFSTDGGLTYPHFSPDIAGSLVVDGFAPGVYDIWVRWGNNDCPTDLGTISINSLDVPIVTVNRLHMCDGYPNSSLIKFSFQDSPQHSGIEFSLDGGVTYPYSVDDADGSLEILGLPPGVYDLWVRWENGNCPLDLPGVTIGVWDSPQVTVSRTHMCANDLNSGSITFNFEDSPQRTVIEFSLTGGPPFPYNAPDNSGSLTLDGIQPGTYDLWVRWGNDHCPVDLNEVTIEELVAPNVQATATALSCNDDGVITFQFPNEPTRGGLEFSINGGQSFPYASPDNAGSFDLTGIAPGTYDVWARWGNNQCPTAVNLVTVGSLDSPIATSTAKASCFDDGEITFTFPDHPTRGIIRFSLNGGWTYPYITYDNVGTLKVTGLAPGTYDLWAKWNDHTCPTNLTNRTIIQLDLPEVTTVKKDYCSNEPPSGEITFTFADSPERSAIEFSIDGGLTFPYWTPDNSGTYTVAGLSAGTYDLWVRWGNNQCPIDLADQTIEAQNSPFVATGKVDVCMGGSIQTGLLTFKFFNDPLQTVIRFSIDGGATYPYISPDDADFFVISGVAVGQYDLWAKWGKNDCPIDIMDQSVELINCSSGVRIIPDFVDLQKDLPVELASSFENFQQDLADTNSPEGRISLFPNPANDFVNLDLTNYESTVEEIKIFNIEGILVKRELINEGVSGIYTADVSGLGSGGYYVVVRSADKEVSSLKFIISK